MTATGPSNGVLKYTPLLATRQLYDNCAPRDSYRHILTNRTAALRHDVTSCLLEMAEKGGDRPVKIMG